MGRANSTISRPLDRLFEVAADQDGYFSAGQARAVNVDKTTLARALARGDVSHTDRGVYRLNRFPESERSTYWEALLWPRARDNVPAVISHKSALALHGLSDVNPHKIDVMVLPGMRIRRQAPAFIRLHQREFEKRDVTRVEGLTVTTPFRTLLDCLIDSIGHDIVGSAMSDGESRGLLSPAEINELKPLYEIHPKILDMVVRERSRAKAD